MFLSRLFIAVDESNSSVTTMEHELCKICQVKNSHADNQLCIAGSLLLEMKEIAL